MFITYAEFHGYERFILNNIKTFKLTMSEIVQIILGTNGSGKSSLVEELTPLPPNKDKFIKGGYKIIELTHGGHHYRVVSSFGESQSHSMIEDGVTELNPGGTMTEQRQLCKKLFNITPDLHGLITGDEKFTAMSPARRREWFTRLNDNNYNYSISVYMKAQSGLRDVSGAIKILRERLTAEAAKRIDENTIIDIRRKLKVLTEESQKLYSLKNTDVATADELGRRVNAQSIVIHDLDKQFRALRKGFIKNAEFGHCEISEIITDLSSSLSQIEGRYSSMSAAHIVLMDKLSVVNTAAVLDVPVLVTEVAALRKKVEAIEARCMQNVKYSNHTLAFNALSEHYESLIDVFTNLPADPDKTINKEAYETTAQSIEQDVYKAGQYRVSIDTLKHKIEHYDQLKAAGSVVCPSCKFSWIQDFDQADYDASKSLMAKQVEALGLLETSIKLNKARMLDMVAYQRTIDPYMQLSRHNRALADLCVYINAKDIVKTSPRQVVTILTTELNNLSELQTTVNLRYEIEEKLQSLQIARKSRESNMELIRQQIADGEEQLGMLIKDRADLVARIDSAKQYKAKLETFANIGDRIASANAALEGTMTQFADAVRNDVVDKLLVETHSTIAILSSHLNEIESQEALVADLEYQISQLQLDEQAWKAVSKALSPVDGLIAEGMLGFIRRFVATMNQLIAKVWTYRLVVKDCSLDEESAELNYKFPLYVAERKKPSVDVLKSSSGQRDMIDLAFVITAMYRSRLEEYPLTLDEFGKAFDEEHREASVRVISDIIDQLGFKQIFMISHYESCWGAFNNAQVCVIDKRNITIPKHIVYNKHCEFIV